MPDRDKTKDESSGGATAPTRDADRNVPQDPDVGQQSDPESQKSTASRPRGHTEEPDRTL